MKVRQIEINDFEDFVDRMRGKVFHATTLGNYESILSCGGLTANTDGSRNSVFGNSNGFFRLRGCVSFFDYRDLNNKKVKQHLYKCVPTNIAKKHSKMAVLVLASNAFINLEPWTHWEREEAYLLKVVPRIEIGYPDFVSLDQITEVLLVSFIS
ncbi:hypothetical protein [Vibrio parahaemolyticus]|uniref:hypothetical protein n=1 Tax=Vibrio parahaemolyticus TaxID=670 RepID=UPI0005F20DD8|nr:hypothetical protein [Vibrio parahaemolyticus]